MPTWLQVSIGIGIVVVGFALIQGACWLLVDVCGLGQPYRGD